MASSIQLADRVGRIQPSPTLALTARTQRLRAEGKDIVSLGAGEPDFDTPPAICAAAIAAIQKGFTRYTAVDGIPGLKAAIADKFMRDNQLSYTAKEILVSCGAKHSLFNALEALLNETGTEEVIIPAPYWVSYPDMVQLAGGKPVLVSGTIENRYKITAAQLAAAITPRTKAFILNSPSNPTGMAYTHAELRAFGEVLQRHPQVLIISDDIYEHTWWSKESFANIAMLCPELRDRCLVVNGVSKAYAMTGWRIGYAAGPEMLIQAMEKIQSQSTSNPNSIAQVAAEAALRGDQAVIQPMVEAFKSRHDYLVDALNKLPGIRCLPGDGTFYAFPQIQGAMEARKVDSDLVFAEDCLQAVGLAVVPGTPFGAPGHIRLSFAASMAQLTEAVRRLEVFLKSPL